MDAQFLSAASSASVKRVGLTSLRQELNPPREETKRKEFKEKVESVSCRTDCWFFRGLLCLASNEEIFSEHLTTFCR